MTQPVAEGSARPGLEGATVVKAVTVIMGTVVGLTFMFGFGNVLNLALRLGVPVWVAPLVAPAVDLSILGLLLGTRHLALTGASAEVLRPAHRLLIFASVVTLALNVADPLVAGEYGKAAFDAVGPLLLIGWAEVGPGFLQAIGAANTPETTVVPDIERSWYGDAWATGIARRALLAAGDRLTDAGLLDDRGQAVDLTHTQLVTLLSGRHVDTGPAREYSAYRNATSVLSAPEFLGRSIEYPKLAWLPPGARRLAEALSDDVTPDEQARSGAREGLPGVPASCGVAVGTARVVATLDDLDRLSEGDAWCAGRRPPPTTWRCRSSWPWSRHRAAPSHTRRSWRGSTASPPWSAWPVPPTSSRTARGCGSTATPVSSKYSTEKVVRLSRPRCAPARSRRGSRCRTHQRAGCWA